MTEPGDVVQSSPQVIRRSDGSFAVINVDTDGLSNVQKVALAVRVWDQFRLLLEASGEYRARDPKQVGIQTGIGVTDDIDRAVAAALGISKYSITRVRPRAVHNEEVLKRALAGKIPNLDEFARELGMILRQNLAEGRSSQAQYPNSYFGLSDKFESAIEPLSRYLRAWRKKSFKFTHVNPKEAKRRIKRIDNVMADLAAAREDLVQRSHVATYAAPSEKTKGEHVR